MTAALEPAMTVLDLTTVLNVDEKTIYRLAQKQGVKSVRSTQKSAL